VKANYELYEGNEGSEGIEGIEEPIYKIIYTLL
jgi:hypothetical protein